MREMAGVNVDKLVSVHEQKYLAVLRTQEVHGEDAGFGEREAAKMQLNLAPQELATMGLDVRTQAWT